MSGITSLLQRMCVDTVVYWGNPRADGFGNVIFDNPVELKCRWEENIQLETAKYITFTGKIILANAEIYLLEDVIEEGYLYKGTLDSLDSNVNPIELEGAYEIKLFQKYPCLGSTTDFVRKAIL